MTTRARCVIAVLGLAAAGRCRCWSRRRRSAPAANTLTAAERAAGWRLLFDGRSLDGWRGYKSDAAPAGWRVVDGTLTKDGQVADIVSRDQFGDFELEMDWKIGDAGNSGIFYRGTEEESHIYWTAPEYQLLDDVTRRGQQDAAHLRRRRLCPLPVAGRAPQAGRRVEPCPHRRPRAARGALAQRHQAARVRAVESRLGSQGDGQQVREVAALRPGHHRAHRDAGRSRRAARVSQHPRSAAAAERGARPLRRSAAAPVTPPGNARRAWPAPLGGHPVQSATTRLPMELQVGPCPSGWSRSRWP